MLIFMHIPKTGGLSLNSYLVKHLRPASGIFIPNALEVAMTSDRDLNSHDYIAMHAGYGLIERITVEHRKVTMLRDPVQRVLSQYYYEQRLTYEHGLVTPAAQTMTIEDYVGSTAGDVTVAIDNAMTWQLFHDNQYYFRFKFKDVPEAELVETAIAHLRTFDLVGLTEAFAASVRRLSDLLGFAGDDFEVEHRTPNKRPLREHDAAVLARIRERVRMDLRVYEAARRIFNSD